MLCTAAGALSGCGSSAGPDALPRLTGVHAIAFVSESTQQTITQRTAQITVQGSVNTQGVDVALTGSGALNFSTDQSSMTLSENFGSNSAVVTELHVDGKSFLGLTINGQSLSSLIGKQWVSAPSGKANVTYQLASDPIAKLKALEVKGAKVVSLASKDVAGIPCRGFAVTITLAEWMADAEHSSAYHLLSASQQAQFRQGLAGGKPPTIQVWFDASGLVREMTTSLDIGGTKAASGVVTLDFSHYGAPVNLTMPSRSTVIPFTRFVQDIKNLSNNAAI